jgi:hypothetical protein
MTRHDRRRRFATAAALLLSAAFLASCSESTSSGRRSDGGRSTASAARGTGPNGDVRVAYFQPAGRTRDGKPIPEQCLILVNENHRLRADERGRYTLALDDPQRAYKVLSEEQADALLKSLAYKDWRTFAQPFRSGDEGYFSSGATTDERFKGVILIESSEGKFLIVGQRGAGQADAAGAQRYQQFVELKSRIIAFTDGAATETPIGGGSAAPVRVGSDD